MPRIWQDFTGVTAGTQPPGWQQWGSSAGADNTLTVESGSTLRIARTVAGGGSGFGRAMWAWTGGLGSAAGETIEVAAAVKVNYTATSQPTLVTRATLGGDFNVAALFIPGGTARVGIGSIGYGPWATAVFAWVPGIWYAVRLRASGSAPANIFQLKVWIYGNPEPADWTVTTGPIAEPIPGGYAGVAVQGPNNGTASVDFDWIGVATGGGPAPLVLSPPAPGFTWSGEFLTVSVTSAATDADGAVVATEYDYGDGSGWTSATSHTYAEYGTYTVTQRVTDSDGLQATDSALVSTSSAGRATAAEVARWAGGRFVTHLDVQIERFVDGAPTLQSYRDFGGHYWIRSLRLAPAKVDTPIGSGTLTLHLRRGSQNLSPLVIGSTLNQVAGEYSPALDFGREIRILTADLPSDTIVTLAEDAEPDAEVLLVEPLAVALAPGSLLHPPQTVIRVAAAAAAGDTSITVHPIGDLVPAGTDAPASHEPGEGDWRVVFEGQTDDPIMGGDGSSMEVPFRDWAGVLADTYPRAATVYGSDGEDDNLLEVARQLVSDWGPAGLFVETFPGPPDYHVTRYQVNEDVSVWEALERLADEAGATVRQEWNEAAGEERITIITPPREKTAPDYVVPPSTYLAVHQVSTGGTNMRNIVRVLATDGETGEELAYQRPPESEVETDPLVQQYGPKFMQMPEEEGSSIDTNAKLVNFGNSIYADVSTPPIPLEMETRFCWFARSDQVVRWEANTVFWDAHLDSAVLGVDHEFHTPGAGRTRWQNAGRPKGGYGRHLRRGLGIAGRNARLPRPAGFYHLTGVALVESLETATHYAVTWEQGAGVGYVHGAAVLRDSGGPSKEARDAALSARALVAAPFMVPKPARDPQFTFVLLEPRWMQNGVEMMGPRVWHPIYPSPDYSPRFQQLDVQSQKVKVVGLNISSCTATRLNAPAGGEWAEDQDGNSLTFNVPVPPVETWEVEVTGHSDPIAERDGDTLTVTETRVVRGTLVTPVLVIAEMSASAPANGSRNVSISITPGPDTPAGLTLTLVVRDRLNSYELQAWELADVTPPLAEPAAGVVQTVVYQVPVRYQRLTGGSSHVYYEFRIEARNSGAVVDAAARVAEWDINFDLPPEE